MDALDIYLGITKPPKNKHLYSEKGLGNGTCCESDENLVMDNGLWLCRECGIIHKDIMYEEVDEYEPYKSPHILKTMIPYARNLKHVRRLHKWQNWSYQEIESKKLCDMIREKKLPINIIDSACYLANEYYIKEKIVSRSKIRTALLVYCVYRAYLYRDIDIDIRKLFIIFEITPKHYNQLVKKLKTDEERLFYPPNFSMLSDKYDIDNNEAIRIYSKLFNSKTHRFNRRTLILGVIYHLLGETDRKSYCIDTKISANTIGKVIKVI